MINDFKRKPETSFGTVDNGDSVTTPFSEAFTVIWRVPVSGLRAYVRSITASIVDSLAAIPEAFVLYMSD